uniref:Uncharacterized protein n=1 Tax=Meloidogyne enterolobii TaxID=390850 RepID=A0A6V7TK79_MELEN|nr:unnamed protein product [Meloidogyne enterolobii]
MPHKNGGGSSSTALQNIPDPLPNHPIVFQLPAIEGFEGTVSERLVKAVKPNYDIDPGNILTF